MKRFITSLLLLAIVPMMLQAHPIDREQARRIANEFLAQTSSNNSQGKRQAPSIQRELAYKELGMKNLYAFADDVNGGFVIVANDDCVEPVLAYSETDTFNPFTMPLSMQVMLLGYEQQLSSISPSNAPVRRAGETSEREAIPPLIQTTWHQYLPLKYNTPFNESAGQNTPVGCVALTLAQIMYYYQYPQGTTITIPAYTTGSGYEMPALPPTTFDYSKMHLNYDHVYEGDRETIDPNDPSLIEVTKLLMYAGCALQMNYSTMGSSAVFDPQVIAKYFDYDKGARYLMAGNYPHEVWEEMVYNELAAGRPIPYSAGAVLNQNHEFIIDGYDGHGYFHANIGEIGRGGFNGFFKLGVLNECHNQTSQVLFSGYNVYQAGIFGFQPNKGNDPVPSVSVDYGNYALPKADFTRKSAGEDFKDIELSASMKRYDNNGHTMDYGWGLYQNGLLKKELCSSTTDQEITSLNMKFNMGSQLADGTYQLFPIFRNHGAKEWELYFEHGYTTEDGTPMRHYTATIENNKLHIGVSSKEPNLNVNKVEYFAAYEGEKLNMRVWFTNNGTNYENLLMLWIDGELAAGVGAYVDPGLSDYIDFCTAAPTKGTHEIKVSADWEGKVIIYTDELTVTDPPECQLEAEVTAKGLIGSVVYKDLDVVCKITNTGATTFADMIDAELSVDEIDENGNFLYRPETGYPAWRWARVWYLHLEPGESAEISFTMGKEIFTPKNYSYGLTILYNNNKDLKNLYVSGYFTYSDNDFINATSIALNKENLSMNLYETETLIATVLPENASDKRVTWSSSDNEVVLVTNEGELHACKAGKAVITAASVYNPEVTASCEVTVLQPVDYLYLDTETLLFDKIGETYQLTATVMPENASNKSVTWASSDEAVCTVSQSGLVTSVGSGTATISATTVDGGKIATCEVTVINTISVQTISLNAETLQLAAGESKKLEATVLPEDATDKSVVWTSSDMSIVSVSGEGVVTANRAGKAVITVASVSNPDVTATCKVTVLPHATSVTLNKANLSLYGIGSTYQLEANVMPFDAYDKSVTWASSDESVCTVSQSGLVTSIGVGKATITVTTVDGGLTATCKVTVSIPLEAISFNEEKLQLVVGESKQLEVIFMPENTSYKGLMWMSSDESVAVVDSEGIVTAKMAGKTVITAASNYNPSITATCEVTVVDDNGIFVLETGDMQNVRAIYDVTGRKMEHLQQGLNILLLNDGSIKKVILKE